MKYCQPIIVKYLPLFSCLIWLSCTTQKEPSHPNILFAISDDQSYPYASAYGNTTVHTPAFDTVAKRGVLFNNAFCAAPQCSPSRAAILTGRNIWQLEEAGTHSSYFPKKYSVFTDALEQNGYALGYTGKPWGPGNWKDAGWERNPVGPEFNEIKYDTVPYAGIRKLNYTANFQAFLDQKEKDKPFFFWFGASEPHRVFEAGSGIKKGKQLVEADVPQFLPDDEVIRNDLLDYAVEIEWFDQHLGQMMAILEEAGELENTIIVVTSDNGMAFPYAKANLQEYGTHVPLAITGPGVKANKVTDYLTSLIDLAPTFLEWVGIKPFEGITGNSLYAILTTDPSDTKDELDNIVLTGRERHTHARPDNLGYPSRAIRTKKFLYILNLKPDRWPAGDPEVALPPPISPKTFKSMKDGYHDIDPSPSKAHLQYTPALQSFFDLAFAKRPEEELYDIRKDPGCVNNLATAENYSAIKAEVKSKLITTLTEQGDPRMLSNGDVFESYPRFGGMREFPGFRKRGVYNPNYQLKQ